MTCIDMFRGGASFRSQKPYQKNMNMQIAVPFSPEANDAPRPFLSQAGSLM